MRFLADATIRSSVLLLLGLMVATLLRRRPAALRHCVLAASMFGAAVVAPLSRALPSWDVALVPASVGEAAAREPSAPDTAAVVTSGASGAAATGLSLLTMVWAAGFAMSATLLAIRVLRLATVSGRARPVHDPRSRRIVEQVSKAYGMRQAVTLLQTDKQDLIATWGVVEARVLLPTQAVQWSDDRMHTVLCHELAHVRRHDWLVQMSAEVLRTVYWFNPLMALACRQLRRESEQACDDAVLGAGVSARSYAGHLLELASIRPRRAWSSAMPMARRSTLERRIAAMLNTSLDRRAPSRRALVTATVLLVAAALPAAALRAAQIAPRSLTGTIYDASGAVLPGVPLTLQDAQEFKWQAVTDASGRFEFPPVQSGRYALEATLPGFRALRDEFELKTAGDWDRAIILQVGELTERVTVSASRIPARSAQAVQPSGPARVRVGGNIRAPQRLYNVNPIFPATMREAGRSGEVPVEAIIGLDGSVHSARVRGGHIHPDFAAAALDAVRQWRYSPTLLNGVPVEVVMTVTVAFSLEE